MMLYMKIENPGTAAPEAFTLFGATSKKYTDDKRMIGLFGSGAKHGICRLLREGINTVIFCGTLRLSHYTKEIYIKGVNGESRQHLQVCVKYGGKDEDGKSRSADVELSVTLDYGWVDWHSISLALRELISNAIDACYEQGLDHKHVHISVVDEKEVRACKGTTRIFIPMTPEVQRFHNHLGKWFLHFSEPHLLNESILPKNGRNVPKREEQPIQRACIYRRGVFVREYESSSLPSLFDYNLCDLQLNESRTFNDYQAKDAIGKALSAASPSYIAKILLAMIDGQEVFESTIESYSMSPSYDISKEEKEQRKKNWETALETVGGSNAVLVGSNVLAVSEMVHQKGFTPVKIKSAGWAKAAEEWGLPTETSILTEDDIDGAKYSEATPPVMEAMEWCWGLLMSHGNGGNNLSKPDVKCYYKHVKEGSQEWGLYKNGCVYIHEEVANGDSDFLKVIMMEELVHHITEATDYSRDFQTFLVRFCVSLGKKVGQ